MPQINLQLIIIASENEKFVCYRLSELEQKRGDIYDKLGRHEQFATKEERDAWLQNELEYVLCIMMDVESVTVFFFNFFMYTKLGWLISVS
jgi:hypothetical protein